MYLHGNFVSPLDKGKDAPGPLPLRGAEDLSRGQTLKPASLGSSPVLQLSGLVTLDKLHNFSVPHSLLYKV